MVSRILLRWGRSSESMSMRTSTFKTSFSTGLSIVARSNTMRNPWPHLIWPMSKWPTRSFQSSIWHSLRSSLIGSSWRTKLCICICKCLTPSMQMTLTPRLQGSNICRKSWAVLATANWRMRRVYRSWRITRRVSWQRQPRCSTNSMSARKLKK